MPIEKLDEGERSMRALAFITAALFAIGCGAPAPQPVAAPGQTGGAQPSAAAPTGDAAPAVLPAGVNPPVDDAHLGQLRASFKKDPSDPNAKAALADGLMKDADFFMYN